MAKKKRSRPKSSPSRRAAVRLLVAVEKLLDTADRMQVAAEDVRRRRDDLDHISKQEESRGRR